MLSFFHNLFEFLGLFQPQGNPHANSSRIQNRKFCIMENGAELKDVDRIICWEMGYNMNRERKMPCREFISSRTHEVGLEKDSTKEDDKYYEGRLVYRVLGN